MGAGRPGGDVSMLTYRFVWGSLAVVAWFVGTVAALVAVPIGALIAVSVFIGVTSGALAIASLEEGTQPRERGVYGLRYAMIGVACTVPALGLVASAGALGVLLTAAFAATSPPIIARWVAIRQRSRDVRYLADAQPPSALPTRAVSELSTSQLVLAWRASFSSLQHARTTAGKNSIVARRQSYIDELERRDPEGIRRWLEAGARPASDPTRYLRPDDGESPSAAA